MTRSLLLPPFAVTSLAVLVAGCGGSAPTQAPLASPGSAAPTQTGPADPDDGLAKLSDEQIVRKLLEVTGASGLGKQVADSMMDSFRKMPNLPPGFIDRFQQNLRTETLVDLIVPIYLKHYDRQTLMAAIRFYESTPGQDDGQGPADGDQGEHGGRQGLGRRFARKTLKDLGVGAP